MPPVSVAGLQPRVDEPRDGVTNGGNPEGAASDGAWADNEASAANGRPRCTMPNVAPLPDLVLYARPGCSLCDEAREAIALVLADRTARGLPNPALVERDIEADPELHRALLERIPVVELGDQRVELVVSIGKLRRLLNEVAGTVPEAEVASEA